MDLLDRAAVTFQLVLTKADGLKPGALSRKMGEATRLAGAHPAAFPRVQATSSETSAGIPDVRAEVANLLGLGGGNGKEGARIEQTTGPQAG